MAKKAQAKTKMVALATIKPNPNNPRTIKGGKLAKLKKSISEFPEMMQMRPIIVDEDYVIIGGNMRLKALEKLGYKEIDPSWVKMIEGLSEEQKKEFVVKDNLNYGEWDWDILLDSWENKTVEDWGLDIPDNKLNAVQIDEKYDNSNCEYPLVPVFDEKYNAVIIICESKTELAYIKSKLNMGGKKKSYKNTHLGESNVIDAKEIIAKDEKDNSKS